MYQRNVSAPPRLAREGWVPAGPAKRVHKRHMLIPKTGRRYEPNRAPMECSEDLAPPERRALREIVETAELVKENNRTYLVACVSSATRLDHSGRDLNFHFLGVSHARITFPL